jgi:hypothetical protein
MAITFQHPGDDPLLRFSRDTAAAVATTTTTTHDDVICDCFRGLQREAVEVASDAIAPSLVTRAVFEAEYFWGRVTDIENYSRFTLTRRPTWSL